MPSRRTASPSPSRVCPSGARPAGESPFDWATIEGADARLMAVDAAHLVDENRPEEFLVVVEAFLVGEQVTSRTPS
ncbi:hypothetical protein [Streptomyces sp. NBC_00343]|uniref:hypothetical protein n=1 Tax=Streptomyces sp. NBC_00343 TaxID=2975719 RepID=UPI002E2D8205|nr:hypothetical protein [Streptomyces sp. NBC_00343]